MLALIPAEYWDYGPADVLRGLTASFGPATRSENLQIEGIGDCIPTRSGRAAILLAIKALGLPPRARIGVPLYCCSVVFKAIEAAGCIPCFLDIDPSTFCISPTDLHEKRHKVDAVIAVHMFGNVSDVTELRQAAPGKPIIEDCCQSLGSKIDGRMAGVLGTVAALSFRSGKYLSVGEGGALFAEDSTIRGEITKLTASMANPSRANELTHVVKTFLRSSLRSRPLYGVVGYPLWRTYNRKVSVTEKAPLVPGQMYRADLRTTRRRLKTLASVVEVQRAHAVSYSQALKLEDGMQCIEKPKAYYNRYLYPITLRDTDQRNFLAAYLHDKQINSIKPLDEIVDVAAAYYGYGGDCPITERLTKTVLVIPSYAQLAEKNIHYIAESVNAGWAEIVNRRNRNST